jgi:hypothetical protein
VWQSGESLKLTAVLQLMTNALSLFPPVFTLCRPKADTTLYLVALFVPDSHTEVVVITFKKNLNIFRVVKGAADGHS